MARLLAYEEKDTWIHRLSGVTKFVFFLLWTLTGILSYDTRVLFAMAAASLILYKMSKTRWRQVGAALKFFLFFLVFHLAVLFLVAPYTGVEIYGSRSDLMHLFGNYRVTKEQLFYELNIIIKYAAIVPVALIFVVTTNPGGFAASLNRIGIRSSIGYSAAIALRFLPDTQDEFIRMRNAQEARGIEMSRIRNRAAIIFSLIVTSTDRMGVNRDAMKLRGFGKHKKRTWYMGRKLTGADYAALAVTAAVTALLLTITFHDGSRFYNPFVG